jgi:hypothetical protein
VIADLWQRGKIARYEGRSTLRTWLGTVVANAAVNASRSRRTVGLHEDAAADGPLAGRQRTGADDQKTPRPSAISRIWSPDPSKRSAPRTRC